MLVILQQILPLFSIIAVGWIITYFKIANQDWNKVISGFAFYVGFPALIFSGLSKATINHALIVKSITINSLIMGGIVVLLLIVFKLLKMSNTNKATYIICFMFGNVAFLGIPLMTSLDGNYNQEATINTAIHLLWVFSVGIFLIEYYTLNKPKTIKVIQHLIKNPLLIASVLGLGFNLIGFQLNNNILKPLDMLGSAVSPLVMVMIGVFIRENGIYSLKQLAAPATFTFLKLLIIPTICILVLNYTTDINNQLVTILDFSMPLAITPFALADHYSLNKSFISNSIIISTIASLISIPLLIEFINWL